jgi:hypothetical protein
MDPNASQQEALCEADYVAACSISHGLSAKVIVQKYRQFILAVNKTVGASSREAWFFGDGKEPH